MITRSVFSALLSTLLLVGCGSSSDTNPAGPNEGGSTGGDGGTDSSGGGSDSGDDGGSDGNDDSGGMGDSNNLFPASIRDPLTHALSVKRTLNGIDLSDNRFGGREGSLPVQDADGDGKADYAFLAPSGLVSDCAAGVLLPSASISTSTLVTSDLDAALRIIHGSGATCRNVSSIYALGDVNGDAQMDIAVFVDPPAGFGPGVGAVVFGGLVQGTVNVLNLDGQNGFRIDGVVPGGYNRGLTSLGDLDADGIDDVLVKNLGDSAPQAWKVINGRAGFPASRSSDAIDDGEVLITLRPQAYIERAGDVNGDGADDIIVNNRVEVGPQIIYGSADLAGETITAGVELVRDCGPGSYCGASALGDIDADGFDDLVVTHSLGSSGCGYGGRSAIFYGNSTGTITLDTLDDEPNPSMTRLVEGVANPCIGGGGFGQVGDLDGDGISDFGISGASGEAIVFGKSGEREPLIWLDDMDGSVGFRIPSDRRSGPLNVDGDDYDDIVFEDGSAFAGRDRSLDNQGPIVTRVERGPTYIGVSWKASAMPAATGYRVEFGGRLIAELDSQTLDVSFDPLDYEAADIVVSVLDASDSVITQTIRQVPAFSPLESVSSIVYGARLVQISFSGDPTVQRYGRYLIWRDGEPLGRAPAGAYDYVDDTVQPGTTYDYFVTPDYLPQGSLDAAADENGPVIRRRSETIQVTTPAG